MRRLRNIYNLGIKELRSLLGDKAMLTLIVFAFTVSVYSSATGSARVAAPGADCHCRYGPVAVVESHCEQFLSSAVFTAGDDYRR